MLSNMSVSNVLSGGKRNHKIKLIRQVFGLLSCEHFLCIKTTPFTGKLQWKGGHLECVVTGVK